MTNRTDATIPARDEYLIVDDEPDLCWSLTNILKLKGLRSQTALSASAAISLMKKHRFRLAFLDVTLPDMSGFELAKRLRAMDAEIRLVLVSGYISMESTAKARAYDAQLFHGCIIKPFLHADILRLVDSCDRAANTNTAPR